MQVDKKLQRKLIDNLEEWLYDMKKDMHDYISNIESCDNVEDLMSYKQDLLVEYIRWMPIKSDLCYFCLQHSSKHDGENRNCSLCAYGKVHGQCPEESSDFWKIDEAQGKLHRLISDKYFDYEDDCYIEVKNRKKQRKKK